MIDPFFKVSLIAATPNPQIQHNGFIYRFVEE